MKKLLAVAAVLWVGRWVVLMVAAYLERRRSK